MNNNDEIVQKTDQCVLFFTKWPAPGHVKTRLGEHIGYRHAAELYRSFVHDLLKTVKRLNCITICCYDPHTSAQAYEKWLGPDHLYLAQTGVDLGQRLKQAFTSVFDQGFHRALVLGTDSPDMPESYLQQALSSLLTHDVALGPSQDGGYYVIGFSRSGFVPDVFQDIPWSTDKVFEQTFTQLEKHQCRIHILPGWYDIDTLEDLNQLRDRHRQNDFAQSETMSAMNRQTLHRSGSDQDGSV